MTDAEYNAKCATDVMGWELSKLRSWLDKEGRYNGFNDTGFGQYFDPANNPAHAMMVAKAIAKKNIELGDECDWRMEYRTADDNYFVELMGQFGIGKEPQEALKPAICAAEGWEFDDTKQEKSE